MNLDEIKEKLTAMQAELTARKERTHKHIHGREERVSADFAEQVVDMENEEVVHALDAEAEVELGLIEKALAKIESGGYGQCVTCGEDIAPERLEAIPFADTCIDCAS